MCSIYYSILFVQTIVIIQTITHIPSQNRLQTNNQQLLSFLQSLINITIFSLISRHAVVDLANKHICFTCCYYKNPILTLKISFCDEFIFHLLNQYWVNNKEFLHHSHIAIYRGSGIEQGWMLPLLGIFALIQLH